MSTNGRENQYFPRIFKGLQERTGHHKKCGALLTIKTYLVNKKRELFPGLLPTAPSSVALPEIWTKKPRIFTFWFGTINPIPF